MKPETKVAELCRPDETHEGVVNYPAYRASTILFRTLDAFDACESGAGVRPLVYGRSGTPASRALEEALAELDGAEHGIITSSGQAAIVVVLMGLLRAGDHMLAPDNMYGSGRKFCDEELTRMGVEVQYYDPLAAGGIRGLLKPNTRLVYCESPGSQTFEIQDIPAIAAAAHAHGAVVVADNTWATPLYQNTAKLGADITVHSCTKYIGGHADIVMGLITCSKKHYPQLRRMYRNLGAPPGSEEVFLAARGLRTLPTRLRRHGENALALARWFSQRPEVAAVLYPALPDSPGHALWQRDFTGATGLFSIILKPYPRHALAAMLDGMECFGMGFSWGAFESLMVPFRPCRTVTEWPHKGQALRVHAGLEHIDDLIADLEKGFARLNKAAA